MKKPTYLWDDYYGVIHDGKKPVQVLQILQSGNKRFRKKCGKLLVDALNKEAGK